MNNMKCVDCALKHLAAAIAFYKELKTFEPETYDHAARVLQHVSLAISYAKEVMSGLDQSNSLDHRADMLGELIIAESLISGKEIKSRMQAIRKAMQSKGLMPDQADLIELQSIYMVLRGEKAELPTVCESDFLGEIMNAEHHLYLVSPGTAFAIGKLRSMFQHDNEPENMAEVLRNHWQNIDRKNYPPAEKGNKAKKKKGSCLACGRAKNRALTNKS